MAKNKDALTTILVVALGVLGFVMYKKSMAQNNNNNTDDNGNGTDENAGYPIIYMKYHDDVKLLQAAVGTKQDGLIGPITLGALNNYYADDPFTASIRIETRNQLNSILDYINIHKYN